MTQKTDRASMMVRIPSDLKRWLQHEAVDNNRSLNNEILHRLEKSRTAQQQAKEIHECA